MVHFPYSIFQVFLHTWEIIVPDLGTTHIDDSAIAFIGEIVLEIDGSFDSSNITHHASAVRDTPRFEVKHCCKLLATHVPTLEIED